MRTGAPTTNVKTIFVVENGHTFIEYADCRLTH